MTFEAWIMLAILIVMFGFLVWNKLPAWIVFVGAFLFPVAVSLANDMGINFMPFAMILMLGISYAFINPTGYQTNLMVQAPGNYQFMDYVKIGLPFTILIGIVALLLTPIIYGF